MGVPKKFSTWKLLEWRCGVITKAIYQLMTSQKISPLDEGKGVIVSRRQSFLTRRKITSPSLTSLNIDKFDQALSPDFTSGFEESEDCFTEITSKAATLIGAERCLLFIKDTKEQKLYTFIKDNEGNKVRATKVSVAVESRILIHIASLILVLYSSSSSIFNPANRSGYHRLNLIRTIWISRE